jgi:hypothetical protein
MLALANTDDRVRRQGRSRPASCSPRCSGTKCWPLGKAQGQGRIEDSRHSIRRWTRCSTCRARSSPSPGASPATSRTSGPCSRASRHAPASAPTPARTAALPRRLRLPAAARRIRRNRQELADWWTRFQEADGEERARMLMPEQAGDKKRRRRRKKKIPAADDRRMNTAYVALGANLGDPTATVLAAFAALANLPESRVARCSSLYRTAPVGLKEPAGFHQRRRRGAGNRAGRRKPCSMQLLDLEARFGRVRRRPQRPAHARPRPAALRRHRARTAAPDPAAPAPAPARLRPQPLAEIAPT